MIKLALLKFNLVGKKLISEYDGANLKEEEEEKPQLLNEGTERRYKDYWEL